MTDHDANSGDRKEPRPRRTIEERADALLDGMSRAGRLAERIRSLFSPVTLFIAGFALLSGAGTYIGLLEVLRSGDNDAGALGAVMVFIFVALITFMMVHVLSVAASNRNSFLVRVIHFIFYVPLLILSLTFGFAFYWTQLNAKNQAAGDALAVLEPFDRRLAIASDNLQSTLVALRTFQSDFATRAQQEQASGNQCGEQSGGTEGPRSRHLRDRAGAVGSFVTRIAPRIEVVSQHALDVRTQIDQVRRLRSATSEQVTPDEREQLFRETTGEARDAAIAVSALAQDGDVAAGAANFRAWAGEYRQQNLLRTEEATGAQFRCFNTGAADALDSAAAKLETLPELEEPEIRSYSGPQGTVEAVNRVIYTLTHPFGLDAGIAVPRDAQLEAAERAGVDIGLRSAQERAAADSVSEAEHAPPPRQGVRPDDYFPLFIAAFVDVLLALTTFMGKPSERFMSLLRVWEEARRVKINPLQVVQRARDLADDPNWSFIEPYLFDFFGDDYLAQPLDRSTPEGVQLYQIATAWKVGGVIRRVSLPQSIIKRRLESVGSTEADNVGPVKYRAWRFTRGSFDWTLLTAMFAGSGDASPATGDEGDA